MNLLPYQIRLPKELLEEIKSSAVKHSEGVVNREVRRLIKAGLEKEK